MLDIIENKMDDVEKNDGSIRSLEHNNDDLPKKAKNWTEFFEKSPMNGMPQIVRSKNFIEKFVWICVVLGGLGATAYMIYVQFDEFTQFKTNSQIRRVKKSKLAIPAITFCSTSRYFWKKEWKSGGLFVPDYWVKLPSDEERLEQQTLSQLYDRTEEYYNNETNGTFPVFPIFQSSLNENDTLNKYMFDNGWFSKLAGTNQSDYPSNPVIAIGNKNRKSLDEGSFTVYQSPTYGTCTTVKPQLLAKGAGRKYGMTFMVDTKEVYSSESEQGNLDGGIKFQVHPATELPNVEEHGVSVGSSAQVTVELTKVLFKRPVLPIPVVCSPILKPLNYFTHYSEHACMTECKETIVYERCQCRGANFRTHQDRRFCSFTDEIECIIPQMDSLIGNSTQLLACMCFAPCKEDAYETKVSYGSYPTKSIISKWASLLGLSAEDLVVGEGHRQYLEQNTVMINLYFGSMKEKVVTETVKKGISGFLSAIGGQFSIFLGISGGSILIILQSLVLLTVKSIKDWRKSK